MATHSSVLGESQGRGSLVGCCLWGCTESDTTEATWQQPELGKIEGKRRRGWQRMRWLDSTSDSVDMNLSKTPGDSEGQACCSPWDRKESDTT